MQSPRTLDRKTLLQVKPKDNSANLCIPFVTTFNPSLPNLNHILNEHWDILLSSDRVQPIFQNCKPLISYRKCKSLKDILTCATVKRPGCQTNYPQGEAPTNKTGLSYRKQGNFKCQYSRSCANCNSMQVGQVATSSFTNTKHKIRQRIDCLSRNVIYLITCTRCNIQYVGQTSRPLKIRINEHKSNIRCGKNTSVSNHFNSSPHRPDDFVVTGLEKVKLPETMSDSDKTRQLLHRESFWIYTLRTNKPTGLNAMDNLISARS